MAIEENARVVNGKKFGAPLSTFNFLNMINKQCFATCMATFCGKSLKDDDSKRNNSDQLPIVEKSTFYRIFR